MKYYCFFAGLFLIGFSILGLSPGSDLVVTGTVWLTSAFIIDAVEKRKP